MKNTRFDNSTADQMHSTFRHEIHIVGRTSPIVGYSKKLDCSEKQDKLQLLKDIVIRLITNKNDYLNQSYCISFFKAPGLDRAKEVEVLSINAKSYVLGGDYKDNYVLKTFLDKVYTDLKNGIKITKEKYIKTGVANKDFDFNLHFDTEADLSAYCTKLHKEHGHPQGRCVGYFHKMKELGKVG